MDTEVRRPATARLSTRDPDVPGFIHWPVRVVAIIVVVPVRLLWELLAVAGAALLRHVVEPIARLLDRAVVRPLAWLWDHLVVIPVAWLWHWCVETPLRWLWQHLVVVPLTWLWARRGAIGGWLSRYLVRPSAWLVRHVLIVPISWVVRYLLVVPISWLVHYLLVVPVSWVLRQLAPAGRAIGRAVVWAWHTAGRALGLTGRGLYRYLLRPLGRSAAWLWNHTVVLAFRGVLALWRVGVVAPARWLGGAVFAPAGRWVRTAVLRPVRDACRGVLLALGVRR